LVPALLNSQLRPVRIVYWLLLPQHLLHCAMQPANLHSYTAAKEISVFVWLLQNVYLDFATLYLLAHR
jgi:hypothetical protein